MQEIFITAFSIKFSLLSAILVPERQRRWSNILLNLDTQTEVALVVRNLVVSLPCPWPSVYQKRSVAEWDRKLDIPSVSRIAPVQKHVSNT